MHTTAVWHCRNTEKCPMYIKYGDRKGTMDAPNPDVVLEGMTAVDHGKIKRDKLMTSVKAETSGEFFGKSSWRPGCSPPMQPTWNHGPPLSADDRPDAIAEPDWTRIMQYRQSHCPTSKLVSNMRHLTIALACVVQRLQNRTA